MDVDVGTLVEDEVFSRNLRVALMGVNFLTGAGAATGAGVVEAVATLLVAVATAAGCAGAGVASAFDGDGSAAGSVLVCESSAASGTGAGAGGSDGVGRTTSEGAGECAAGAASAMHMSLVRGGLDERPAPGFKLHPIDRQLAVPHGAHAHEPWSTTGEGGRARLRVLGVGAATCKASEISGPPPKDSSVAGVMPNTIYHSSCTLRLSLLAQSKPPAAFRHLS